MYDFIKIAITDLEYADKLINNRLLNFYTRVNTKTGELIDGVYEAKYQNLKFIIYPSGRVEIKGSLHKYWNDGKHNYNDFYLTDVAGVLLDLQYKFKIDLSKARVHNLEFGLNVITPFKVNALINNLISYKSEPFKKMWVKKKPGNGRDVYFDQYGVKVYNKGLQYYRTENILRFEKKVLRMECLGWGEVYLSDLTDRVFANHCLLQLIECFNGVIITEKVNRSLMTKSEIKSFDICANPRSWKDMSRNQRCTNKARFKAIISTHGTQNLHSKVEELLLEKGEALINISEQNRYVLTDLIEKQNVPFYNYKTQNGNININSNNLQAVLLN